MLNLDFEPKDFALKIAGTYLEFPERVNPDPLGLPFPAFSIPSVPNFDMFHVEAHNAGTITEEAYFDFMVKSSDEVFWHISEGDLCSCKDKSYIYSFIISDSPKPDMTGWSILRVNYIGKAYV
jgi:hypothetical protein